MLNIPWI